LIRNPNAPLNRLSGKLSDYAVELRFAARAPVNARQRAKLMRETLAFHYRNWRKVEIDSGPRLKLDLDVGTYQATVTLRPRDGDLSILYEIFARDGYKVSDKLLPPASVHTIVDAGANIGFASLYLAARYRNAKIYSIEPNPENFALLKGNTAQEPRIVPIQACLTAVPEEQVFISTSGRASHFKMNTRGQGVSVKGISIEQLCREHAIDRIELLKIDVEGAEKQIFAGATFLSKIGVIVAELHGDYTLDRFNEDLARDNLKAHVSEYARDPQIVIASRG
jgi:FkbM family methyltransferase